MGSSSFSAPSSSFRSRADASERSRATNETSDGGCTLLLSSMAEEASALGAAAETSLLSGAETSLFAAETSLLPGAEASRFAAEGSLARTGAGWERGRGTPSERESTEDERLLRKSVTYFCMSNRRTCTRAVRTALVSTTRVDRTTLSQTQRRRDAETQRHRDTETDRQTHHTP
eukprot:1251472-Rhodomonas_salina.1